MRSFKVTTWRQTESNKVRLDSEGNPYGEIDLESEEDFCDEEGKGSIISRGWLGNKCVGWDYEP